MNFNLSKHILSYDNKIKLACDAPLIGGGHTGAPLETNCATTGCHTGGINNSTGITIFDVGGGITQYTAGQTYPVHIKILQAGFAQFGFQLVSLRDIDDSLTGSYSLTNTFATRIINGPFGRKYVGTTPCGSDAMPTDSLEWSFNWTAPVGNVGNITFYLNTISSNHNIQVTGDHVYSTTLQLTPASIGVNEKELIADFSLSPVPAQDYISVKYKLQEECLVNITISGLDGKNIQTLLNSRELAGNNNHTFSLSSFHLSDGVYILKLTSGSFTSMKKLMIAH